MQTYYPLSAGPPPSAPPALAALSPLVCIECRLPTMEPLYTFPCGCFLPAHGACLVRWRETSRTCERCGTTTIAVSSYLRDQDATQNRYTMRVRIVQTILIMIVLTILIYCVVHYLFKL